MNDAKHTPGPWEPCGNHIQAETPDGTFVVCRICPEDENMNEDDIENMRLIASAPQLVEALCSIREDLRRMSRSDTLDLAAVSSDLADVCSDALRVAGVQS